MSLKKTIECKYCGEPVTGEPIFNKSQKVLDMANRVIGTVSSIMNGNPMSTYRAASGKSSESAIKAGQYIAGGIPYHFECKNPNCMQSFDEIC